VVIDIVIVVDVTTSVVGGGAPDDTEGASRSTSCESSCSTLGFVVLDKIDAMMMMMDGEGAQ
jgi:hypothetical protein